MDPNIARADAADRPGAADGPTGRDTSGSAALIGRDIPQAPGLPSVEELVRVLDVATEVRRKQETLDRLWDVDAARTELRETLRETASLSGEHLTEAEIDTAVDWYYRRLHRYTPPRRSLRTLLAHLYVRRWGVLLCLVAAALAIWGIFAVIDRQEAAAQRETAAAAGQAETVSAAHELVRQEMQSVRELLSDPDPRIDLDRWGAEADRYRAADNLPALGRLGDQIRGVRTSLEQEFDVHVIGVSKLPEVPDQFLARLRATDAVGKVRDIEVLNTDYGERVEVSNWEQYLPMEHFEVLRAGVTAGGDNRPLYAVKQRGRLDWEVKLLDRLGSPLPIGLQFVGSRPEVASAAAAPERNR